jgi:hypothetical protein
MKGKFNLLKPAIWAIVLGVVSNGVYWILTIYINKLKPNVNIAIITFLIACLVVALFQLFKYNYLLKKLGVITIYDKAKDTIIKGLQEADYSYCWLGTSAYYVVVNPELRDEIEKKRKTDFPFITIDPECSAVLSEQAKWEHCPEDEIAWRIAETKKSIQVLNQKGIRISWESHSTFPTFRVVIINRKKLLVSFYEEGKLGPDCEQLEIKASGLLGQWFIQFFKKSRSLASRMRVEKYLARLLFKNTEISKDKLLEELRILCPDENTNCLKQVLDDLSK